MYNMWWMCVCMFAFAIAYRIFSLKYIISKIESGFLYFFLPWATHMHTDKVNTLLYKIWLYIPNYTQYMLIYYVLCIS